MSIKKCSAMGINLPFNAIRQAGENAYQNHLRASGPTKDFFGAACAEWDAIMDSAERCVLQAGYRWSQVHKSVVNALVENGNLG